MLDCFIITDNFLYPHWCMQFKICLIFHQNTHQCADLHTSVLTLNTITSVYVLILYAGMLILHASVLIVHVGMLNF